jgi:2-polyprenyl-6-methoxyphenol hydroxylase-like FAD-dependent oxidoreductase
MAAPYVPCYAVNPSKGAVTLIGDAAGASHPLGGMGMSTAAFDGVLLAELLAQNANDQLTLKYLNETYNKERVEKYLNGKFVSEFLSSIIGGSSRREKVWRRFAVKLWSENARARDFCGKLFGGLVDAPLDLTGLLKIWGVQKDLSFLKIGTNVPKNYYFSRAFSPGKFFSDIIR